VFVRSVLASIGDKTKAWEKRDRGACSVLRDDVLLSPANVGHGQASEAAVVAAPTS
jgi:hypothetical protein